MKKYFVLVTLLSASLHLSVQSAYSQGKGSGAAGHVPSVNQGHTKSADNSHATNATKPNQTQTSDHSKTDGWQTKLSDRFENDSPFRTRMQGLLNGMDLKTAESGFRNQGQFIAALHVSQNLQIPFDLLKAKMTGVSVDANGKTINSTPESLGNAIHDLKPTLTVNQSNDAAKKAEKQAAETEKVKTATN